MRLPGMHALLTAGVAVLTTAGTVSAVSLTAAGREEPALPPAPPAAPAPPAPAPPPLVPAPAPAPSGGSAPVVRDDTGGVTRERETAAPEPVEPAPVATPAPADPPRTTPERTRERPSGVPDRDASREEEVRFACAQGWVSGALCP
ncbi:hypothetical protein [Pseudonocardia alni]|uniref:hypothetical protein n=1 Tax=Pseudonocardia alni TaxID=33907 RepID=UPI0033193036